MNLKDDSPPRAFAAWAPVVVLTALALWLRLKALPGIWGTDSLSYVEAVRAGLPPSDDPRWLRRPFLDLVRIALRMGGSGPAWASIPGVLASAAVVPVLWLALRRRVGDGLALLAPAIWTFLGSDLEELGEVSADAMLALPAALAAWGLVVAARESERAVLPLLLAGLAAGAGAALKETMLLACVGLGLGALSIGGGARRVRNAALFAGAAAAVFVACLLVFAPHRLGSASHSIAGSASAVHPESASFLRRVTIQVPLLLFTASQAYGLLFVVCLPLLARLPLRALRGEPLAVAALGGLLAFDLVPVSLESWSLLPATFPRYYLCLMPALLLATVAALQEPPASRVERWLSLAGAVGGLLFVRSSAWAAVLVPPGVVLAAWPALPDALRKPLPDRLRLPLTGAVLLAATVAWPRLTTAPSTADLAVAGVFGVLVTTPWLVGRDRGSPLPYLAIGAAMVLAVTTTRARFVPDPGWDAWDRLPRTGRVYAEELVGRRLLAAAPAAGADPSRVDLLESHAELPARLEKDDRLLVLDAQDVGRGPRLVDRCRDASSLRQVDVALGEALLFEPVR